MTRVLIAGGYGVVGSWIARELRAAHPNLGLVIAGRNPESGGRLAAEVGAETARLDVGDPETGLKQIGPVDLVVASLQDPGDNLAMAALAGGAGYITITQGPDSLSLLAIASRRAGRPALVLSYWLAGATTFAAMEAAKARMSVERIELAALYDPADPIGPMTASDSAGFFGAGALVRQGAAWVREDPTAGARTISRRDAPPFEARSMSVLDVPGLAATTLAPNIRFDLGVGPSMGALRGGGASTEIYIDLWGQDRAGDPRALRTVVSDPKGQAHLTALGVVIGSERLLGLDGEPPLGPGIAFPEDSIDSAYATRRLRELGVTIERLEMENRL
jgi:hypothetical protein